MGLLLFGGVKVRGNDHMARNCWAVLDRYSGIVDYGRWDQREPALKWGQTLVLDPIKYEVTLREHDGLRKLVVPLLKEREPSGVSDPRFDPQDVELPA